MDRTSMKLHAALVLGIGLLTAVTGIAAAPKVMLGAAHVVLSDGRSLEAGGKVDGHVTAHVDITQSDKSRQGPPQAMLHPRSDHTATVLPNGRVLIWGGVDESGHVVAQGEWFDPATGQFSEANGIKLLPRAGHSATVLTDGRLLLIGGHAENLGRLAEAEIWDWRTNRSELLPTELSPPREGHSASLLADGRVLIMGPAGADSALYDPERVRFLQASQDTTKAAQPANGVHVAGSSPAADAHDVALDSVLAVRFDPPLASETLDSSTVTLLGPHGATPIDVVAAEAGRLVFVTPKQELFPASHYTLFVQGAHDKQGHALPWYGLDFETLRIMPAVLDPRLELGTGSISDAAAPTSGKNSSLATSQANRKPAATAKDKTVNVPLPVTDSHFRFTEPQGSDDEFWVPSEANLDGHWRTQRAVPADISDAINLGLSKNSQQNAWRRQTLRASGTEISGRVLSFNDRPLVGVDVRVGKNHTTTDASGRFVIGVATGHQELEVDGATINHSGDTFGQFVIGVDAEAGKENPVKPIYLPKIRQKDWIDIPSPLPADMVIR
ncbi:MAG: kelch repeat-containing protein, partial [Dokdonella sp.]